MWYCLLSHRLDANAAKQNGHFYESLYFLLFLVTWVNCSLKYIFAILLTSFDFSVCIFITYTHSWACPYDFLISCTRVAFSLGSIQSVTIKFWHGLYWHAEHNTGHVADSKNSCLKTRFYVEISHVTDDIVLTRDFSSPFFKILSHDWDGWLLKHTSSP